MGSNITREHATAIIKKLKAKPDKARKSKHHLHYEVRDDEGAIVATFSVSHTVKKSKPQNHIPEEFGMNRMKTRRLAECKISRYEFLQHIQDIEAE